MKYKKSDAKEYARENMRGVWGGSFTPFTPEYKIDEEGFKSNIRYCSEILQLGGMYVNALQGESLYQTIAERKRIFKSAVEASKEAWLSWRTPRIPPWKMRRHDPLRRGDRSRLRWHRQSQVLPGADDR